MEDHHERAATQGDFLPGVERQQNGQRTDVEQQDAVDHLVGRARDAVPGVIGLGCGNTHQFQPAEREHDHGHGHHQPACPIGEKATVLPQVGDACIRATRTGCQQPGTEGDHADDRGHLDQGEPELHLAEDLDLGQVDQVDDHKEHRRRCPGREARPPVLDVDAHRRQLGHADQHIEYPVVPTGHEAGELAPVTVGEVAEGARYRLFDHHFAQLAHDEERDQAGDGVTEQNRRARHLDCLGNTEKKPGADGATQCDQLDMAVFQAPAQALGCRLFLHGSSSGSAWCSIYSSRQGSRSSRPTARGRCRCLW
ncbi:hypothetical protein D3C85_1128850 [compost metagenome]